MEQLTEDRAVVGLHVMYVGAESSNGIDAGTAAAEYVLSSGHPGTITHVHGPTRTTTLCLPRPRRRRVSIDVGWDTNGRGRFDILAVLDAREWEGALSQGWWANEQ